MSEITLDPLYEPIRDTANLLSALVRDRASYVRAPKTDPLIQRYMALKPDIMAVLEPLTVESQMLHKVMKRPGWRITKADIQAKRDGTYRFVHEPEVTVPKPDGAELLRQLQELLAEFPTFTRSDPQFAARFAKLKARK